MPCLCMQMDIDNSLYNYLRFYGLYDDIVCALVQEDSVYDCFLNSIIILGH